MQIKYDLMGPHVFAPGYCTFPPADIKYRFNTDIWPMQNVFSRELATVCSTDTLLVSGRLFSASAFDLLQISHCSKAFQALVRQQLSLKRLARRNETVPPSIPPPEGALYF